jgi:hypothetical protein
MKRCSKCNALMPDDALRCIRCGSESPPNVASQLAGSIDAKPVSGADTRGPRRINWTRVFAVVLTSKLFFLASCTGGMVLVRSSFDGNERFAHGAHERPLDTLMSVIAVIPSTDKPSERKVVQVPLFGIEQFKQDHPNFSFLPPLGNGEVNNPAMLAHTAYTATIIGPGQVMVETKLDQNDDHVLGRYEATDKEIKPLYTKTNNDLINFIMGMFVGVPIALVLALIGYVLKRRVKRTTKGATVSAASEG